MSQISKAIFGALVVTVAFSAAQLVAGQDTTGQPFAGRFQAVSDPTGADINRTAKGNREANVPAPAPTRTIQLKVDSVADTSVLVRIPVVKEARNLPAPTESKAPARKERSRMAVACEPTVSVLTEIAKLMQPGRCVT